MNIAVDGNNFFHLGWLAHFLGLPRKHPAAGALHESDVAAFEDGWDTCNETPTHYSPSRLDALRGMLQLGQAVAYWVDEENNEIDPETGRKIL